MRTSLHDSRLAERVLRVADGVRRRLGSHRRTRDSEDIFQEAALAALEAVHSGKIRERQNPRGYMYRAAMADASLAYTRWLTPVTISEHLVKVGAKQIRKFQNDTLRVDEGEKTGSRGTWEKVDRAVSAARPTRNPEQLLGEVEEARTAHSLRIRQRRRAERYLRRLTENQREAVELLLGWDGRPCEGEGEAARMAGTTVKQVKLAIRRFRRMAWDDIELRRLQRRLEDTEG